MGEAGDIPIKISDKNFRTDVGWGMVPVDFAPIIPEGRTVSFHFKTGVQAATYESGSPDVNVDYQGWMSIKDGKAVGYMNILHPHFGGGALEASVYKMENSMVVVTHEDCYEAVMTDFLHIHDPDNVGKEKLLAQMRERFGTQFSNIPSETRELYSNSLFGPLRESNDVHREYIRNYPHLPYVVKDMNVISDFVTSHKEELLKEPPPPSYASQFGLPESKTLYTLIQGTNNREQLRNLSQDTWSKLKMMYTDMDKDRLKLRPQASEWFTELFVDYPDEFEPTHKIFVQDRTKRLFIEYLYDAAINDQSADDQSLWELMEPYKGVPFKKPGIEDFYFTDFKSQMTKWPEIIQKIKQLSQRLIPDKSPNSLSWRMLSSLYHEWFNEGQ